MPEIDTGRMPGMSALGFELPIVQAGMGGGISRAPLAAAVSEAGGLGTIGLLPPDELEQEIDAARALTGRPIAVNLLLPFARPGHWRVADQADVVVTFWGKPKRHVSGTWWHQCGSVEEALAARAEGADAVIAQGVEAGGHVRGDLPALDLLERVRAATGPGFPVLLAGGLADAADVRRALGAGAAAAVLGTRFVMTEESSAHAAYKQRLTQTSDTVLTELFGAGWPHAKHRVARNAACERWLDCDGRPPRWVLAAERLMPAATAARLPPRALDRVAAGQRLQIPFFGPLAPTADRPASLLETGALYAGESVARIDDVRPAAEVVRDLIRPGPPASEEQL
jgi:nitronate monooxygenase